MKKVTKEQRAMWLRNLPKKDDKVARKLFQQAINRPDVQAALKTARNNDAT